VVEARSDSRHVDIALTWIAVAALHGGVAGKPWCVGFLAVSGSWPIRSTLPNSEMTTSSAEFHAPSPEAPEL
jgi:hypothetical protein